MKTEKNDRRVIYTKTILTQTLIKLLLIKPFDKVSIAELCKETGITRATFYAHYNSIFELLNEIQNDFMDDVKSDVIALINSSQSHNVQIIDLMTKVYHKKDLCKVFFMHGEIDFHEKIVNLTKESLIKTWYTKYNVKNLEFLNKGSEYLIAGCVGLIRTWLSNDCKESPEEIAIAVEKMSYILQDEFIKSGTSFK
jgi:AcrR family transcriptional regulator